MIGMKILGMVLIIILISSLQGSISAEKFEKKKTVITLKTWSMVGDGRVCIFNYDAENKCNYFNTTYKDKWYKEILVTIPTDFLKKNEVYKVCINFKEFASNGPFWNDCIIDQSDKKIEKLFLSLQAFDQFDDKRYLGLE